LGTGFPAGCSPPGVPRRHGTMVTAEARQPLAAAGQAGSSSSHIHPALLEWEDITFTVKEKKRGEGLTEKKVLSGISGHAAPGSFTVILGASGSGKTSLLSVLADRLLYTKAGSLTGTLKVNGERAPVDFRNRCAFVQQTEVFYPFSSVRETVEMAARLRLGRTISKEDKIRRALEVTQLLGLSKALDTKVGNNADVKGISGGEMKRVGIACELVSSPSLVLLDEPTSGLDSTAALNVVRSLNDLAGKGHTVIASIHQPGSALYALFGNLVVLAEGRLAYFGSAQKVMEHFSAIGYACPPQFNPAEYVIQVTSIDTSSAEAEQQSREGLRKIHDEGAKTVTLARQVSVGVGPRIEIGGSFCEEFVLLYRRILKQAIRNKLAIIIKLVQAISTTLIMCALYSNLDGGGVVAIANANISALLFFITINGLFGPLFNTIQAFSPEVNIVLRERMNNLYSVAPYYASKLLVAIPFEAIPLLLGNSVAFWLLKLEHSATRYLLFLIFTCGMTLCSVGVGFMLAAATGGNVQAASASVGPLALVMLLLGGFFINTSTIPVWIDWLSKVSYVSWAFQGLATNQYNGAAIKAAGYEPLPDGSCRPGANPTQCVEGVQVLGDLFNNGAAKTEAEWTAFMWERALFILLAILIFNFLAYLVLLAKGPKYLTLTRQPAREEA